MLKLEVSDDTPVTGVVSPPAGEMPQGLRPLRDGDQGYPVGNGHPSMHDKVIDDTESRRQLGIQRYGVPLQPANGRDAARDAYEEALDGAAYSAQVVWEQQNPKHTYVGWLISAMSDHEITECHVGADVFVPEGVIEYAHELGIEFIRE